MNIAVAEVDRHHLVLKHGRDERRMPVQHGTAVLQIVEIIALERNCAVEELIIIREGEPLPLDLNIVFDPEYPSHRRHHVHHKTPVKVEVEYNGGTKHHEYKRHATIGEVLAWAVDVFKIDAVMATDFELAIHAQTVELPKSEHVGHLAGRDHEIRLDLVRGIVVNGAAK